MATSAGSHFEASYHVWSSESRSIVHACKSSNLLRQSLKLEIRDMYDAAEQLCACAAQALQRS